MRIRRLLEQVIAKHGESEAAAALERLLHAPSTVESTLTIVANGGVHPLSSDALRGEVFFASHGNLNLADAGTLHDEYRSILRRLAAKLRDRPWRRIYLIPTGPPTLSLQIKLLVYQINRLATVDMFYSNGQYIEVCIGHRELLVK